MRPRVLIPTLCVLASLVARESAAQVPVIDVAALIQTVQIAYNTYEAYRTLVREYEVLVAMARRHPNMERYRTPDVPFVFHNTAAYPEGAPFLEALNAGDPAGALYARVIRPADRADTLPQSMPTDARLDLGREYATLDVADSTGQMAIHQVGHLRSMSTALAEAIRAIETDTLGGSDNEHGETAILDRLNAASIIARRQDEATNQLLSHYLEQELVSAKRARDAEAIALDLRISQWRYYDDYSRSFFTEASHDQMRAWRQP
jgi:hypothetical protein